MNSGVRMFQWVPRDVLNDSGPKTIQQVREEAAKVCTNVVFVLTTRVLLKTTPICHDSIYVVMVYLCFFLCILSWHESVYMQCSTDKITISTDKNVTTNLRNL